jgi:hypothetical protein
VFEGLCHTAQVAFTEVPDAEAGQIEALVLPYFFYCDIDFSHLSSVNVMTTYPHIGMNSWVCLFLIIMIFVFFRSFLS